MTYYSDIELRKLGFKYVGENVKVSDKACIYDHHLIEIGDHSRIDDLCVISGKINIGSYVHIVPMCLLAGGEPGITLESFTTVAYGVKIFSQSDDYSGLSLTNSTIPKKYKYEIKKSVLVKKHSIIGTNSVIFPGVILQEGTSVGAMSMVTKSTEPWGIYFGVPAKKIKARKKELLILEQQFLKNKNNKR